MKRALTSFLFSLLVLGLLLSCDFNIGGGPEPNLPQTEILGFGYSPNDTVQVGDTLRITCVIEDSTNTSFRFSWSIRNIFTGLTENATLSVIIPELDDGKVSGVVIVSSPEPPEDRPDPVTGDIEFYIQ